MMNLSQIRLTHYRLILVLGTFVYPTWKFLHYLGLPTPEPLWARIPAFLIGSFFLFLSYKKPVEDFVAKMALALSLYTTAEFIYLVYYQYFTTPQVFNIYVIGGFVVLGCYTICWKHIDHLVTYSVFSFCCVIVAFCFLYFGDAVTSVSKPELVSYLLLYILQFVITFSLTYTYIKQTVQAQNQIAKDQLALVNSQKISQVSEMAGGIAHEIKNPLMGMTLNLQKLEMKLQMIDQYIPANLKDKLSITQEQKNIEESMSRITNTIDTLLIFSRNKSISDSEKIQDYDILKIVENAINLCSSQFVESNIFFKNYTEDVSIFVKCNQSDLFQVVYNLIKNACEAIDREKNLINRIVTVKTHIDPNNSEVKLIIEDTAPLITSENVKKLFIPFFTTKELSKNNGTGLSISKGIIEEMGGHILYSEQPKSFSIVLKYDRMTSKVIEHKEVS